MKHKQQLSSLVYGLAHEVGQSVKHDVAHLLVAYFRGRKPRKTTVRTNGLPLCGSTVAICTCLRLASERSRVFRPVPPWFSALLSGAIHGAASAVSEGRGMASSLRASSCFGVCAAATLLGWPRAGVRDRGGALPPRARAIEKLLAATKAARNTSSERCDIAKCDTERESAREFAWKLPDQTLQCNYHRMWYAPTTATHYLREHVPGWMW
jgi:hypothetical protein